MGGSKGLKVRKNDGIEIQTERKYCLDGSRGSGDVNIVSHGHSDHALKKKAGNVLCSNLTGKITSERFEIDIEFSDSHEKVEMLDSGHIIGSRSFLIDDRVLYTGDVALRDRAYLEGFEPVDAEVLIVESTYGVPSYRLPSQGSVEEDFMDWIQDTDLPVFLFGYSLGKAQKIQYLVQEAVDREIVAHGAVKKMNDVIENHSDLSFEAKLYSENKEVLESNGVFIGPPSSARADYIDNLVEKVGGVKAGFSGWAVQDSFKYRGGYDNTFPYSDHCGFDDLVRLVEKVDPDKVYTYHGFDEAFASYLKREKGFNARALKNNQSSLDQF
ncbi:MAG: MBL fold metallo-hydrolase RNA specificity domain-containing protein [Candidatus Nanohaloarchaea archaeon]